MKSPQQYMDAADKCMDAAALSAQDFVGNSNYSPERATALAHMAQAYCVMAQVAQQLTRTPSA